MPFIEQPATDLPGLVVTGPENVTDRIPYEKQDRVPAALQPLEVATAQYLMIDRQRLVGLQGEIREHGSILFMGVTEDLASTVIASYVVAVFDARRTAAAKSVDAPLLIVRQRADAAQAREVFAALRDGLDG